MKQNQSLNFPSIPTQIITPGKKFTNVVTVSSGLAPVIQTSGNTAVATVSNNVLTLIGSGSTTITATQAGNNLWNPISVSQPLVVNTANQTLTFSAIPAQVYATNKKLNLNVTSSAGLTNTTFISSNLGVATSSNNTLTITGVGITTITATNSGNTYFGPASATQNLTVSMGVQTLTLAAIPQQTASLHAVLTINARSSAGLSPITYTSSKTNVASFNNNALSILGAGTTTITASQGGNNYYTPATVSQTLIVR